MPRFRTSFAFIVPAALLFACSSSSSTGTGTTAGTGGSKASASASTTATSTSSGAGTGGTTGTGTVMGTGGSAVCENACTASNAAAYQKFQGYQLASCGCASGAPCATDCASACPTGTPSMACNTCIAAQQAMTTNSACITSAGETCISDTTCSPFIACELQCPGAP